MRFDNAVHDATLKRAIRLQNMRAIRVAPLVIAVALLCGVSAGSSTGQTRNASTPVLLGPKWRLVATGVISVIAQGSDAVLIRGRPGHETGIVIDDTTGSRRVVSRSGYESLHVGGGWVMFWNPFGSGGTGDPALVPLYRVSSGQWRIVRTPGPTSPSCGGPCGGGPAAVGGYWLAYGNPVLRYQNISSGQVRQDPTTTTTVPDLDSPSLSRAVCPPLRVPPSYNPPKNLGSLTFDGQFAIAESQGPPIVGDHGVYPGLESFVLERGARTCTK